jgi:hypothetical protein
MRTKFFRIIFTLFILVTMLSVVGWLQAPELSQAAPPAVEEPAGLSVEVIGPSSVAISDTFTVDIVASNIPEPGIFGYQFVLNWDDTVFSGVSVTTNPDFPVLAVNNLGPGLYEIAASREGDVADLLGPITLATVELQANAVTDPDSSLLALSGVKLGRKGGIDVAVAQQVDLAVVVIDVTGDDIVGNVKVEGRATDNQAGHTVEGAGLSTSTDVDGSFTFAGIEFGTYTFTADSPGFLAATCEDVVHASGLTILADVVLLAGDLNSDNVIDVADAVAIGLVFGSTEPGEIADLNVDGVVDILDLILMSVNYDQTSLGNPWICQPL